MPKAFEVFIHKQALHIFTGTLGQRPRAFGQTKKTQKPSGFGAFVQFEEVFRSIDQIMYLTYHSRESVFAVNKQHLFPYD